MSFYTCTDVVADDYMMRECLLPGMVEGKFETFTDGDFACTRTFSTTDKIMRIVCEQFIRIFSQDCPANVTFDVRVVPDGPDAFDNRDEVYATVLTGMAAVMAVVLGSIFLIHRCTSEGN